MILSNISKLISVFLFIIILLPVPISYFNINSTSDVQKSLQNELNVNTKLEIGNSNVNFGDEIYSIKTQSKIVNFEFSPDGRFMVYGLENGDVNILDLATGNILKIIETNLTIINLKFSPNQQYLAIIGTNSLQIYLFQSFLLYISTSVKNSKGILAFSADSTQFVVDGGASILHLINLITKNEKIIFIIDVVPFDFVFNDKGDNLIIIGGGDGEIYFDINTSYKNYLIYNLFPNYRLTEKKIINGYCLFSNGSNFITIDVFTGNISKDFPFKLYQPLDHDLGSTIRSRFNRFAISEDGMKLLNDC